MDPNNSGSGYQAHSAPGSIPPHRGYALSGKITLSAIVVLFTVVLLLLFIHLYARWRVYRRESRRRRNPLVIASGDHAPSSLAAPRGLDPKVLNSLAVVIFSSKDDLDDEGSDADVAAECAVCLNVFDEGEKVRVLPRCNHRFHIGCIDMWFRSHNSCPLCRSPVEIEAPQPAAEELESPPPQPQQQQCAARSSESSSDSADHEVIVETTGGGGELGSGFGSEPPSGQKSRILAIMRFLSRDPRWIRGEVDLERGEGAVRNSPPPPAAE